MSSFWYVVLSILIFSSGLLHIRADYSGKKLQTFWFKPLTVLLIILLCILQSPGISQTYKYLILTGLGFSLTGDIFLMLPSDRFIAGLISFLAAHVCYIFAFAHADGFHLHLLLLAPVILVWLIILIILIPHTGSKAVPVIIYSGVLLLMMWQALERQYSVQSNSAELALAGAILFVVSDSTLAYNRFVKQFHAAQLIILLTYYCAQWFIALSV